MSYVKFPPPRPLTKKETLDTLDHWRSQFRTFFKRDDTFRPFLSASFKWDPAQTNFGFTNETNEEGDVYDANEKAENFPDLLNVLSGFLPHSYLTSRISKDTKCWQDVWDIIYQHYNCKISSDSFLDFESLKKESDENYLQFYERLLQHTRLHLAPANAEVGTLKNNKNDSNSRLQLKMMKYWKKTKTMKMKTPQFGFLKLLHATGGEARQVLRALQVLRAALEEEEVRDLTIITLKELQDISRTA